MKTSLNNKEQYKKQKGGNIASMIKLLSLVLTGYR